MKKLNLMFRQKLQVVKLKACQEFKTKIQFTGNQPSISEMKDSTIFQYTFLLMDPKNFPKAPWAPIYTNFEGAVRRKNEIFWSKFSKNCPKTLLGLLFFQNLACGAENLDKTGTKQCLGSARNINLVDLKKRSTKFSNFFFVNVPLPPRENPRSAPECTLKCE